MWIDINIYNSDPERVDYPTQKPEKLLNRIIGGLSKNNSLVADFFCGSAPPCAVAENLRR